MRRPYAFAKLLASWFRRDSSTTGARARRTDSASIASLRICRRPIRSRTRWSKRSTRSGRDAGSRKSRRRSRRGSRAFPTRIRRSRRCFARSSACRRGWTSSRSIARASCLLRNGRVRRAHPRLAVAAVWIRVAGREQAARVLGTAHGARAATTLGDVALRPRGVSAGRNASRGRGLRDSRRGSRDARAGAAALEALGEMGSRSVGRADQPARHGRDDDALLVVVLDGLRKLGFHVTTTEAQRYVQLWRYVGWLLGTDHELLFATREKGLQLADRITKTQVPPDDDSRALTKALFESGTRGARDDSERSTRDGWRPSRSRCRVICSARRSPTRSRFRARASSASCRCFDSRFAPSTAHARAASLARHGRGAARLALLGGRRHSRPRRGGADFAPPVALRPA